MNTVPLTGEALIHKLPGLQHAGITAGAIDNDHQRRVIAIELAQFVERFACRCIDVDAQEHVLDIEAGAVDGVLLVPHQAPPQPAVP